ncbi:MAG: hypothetical protein IJ555_09340 [Ruminococcus sp.]|nr:hypothetical protein [Ruminococcus sp.]
MAVYAQVSDIIALGRELSNAEQATAEVLLEQASAKLRMTARQYGCNIDEMIADKDTGADYALVVKSVVVQSVLRALDSTADTNPPAVQASQAALGYSVSMTYLNSGQALYFLKNELKELGLLNQRFGVVEVYDNENRDQRDNSPA